jgi:hypothetical protein
VLLNVGRGTLRVAWQNGLGGADPGTTNMRYPHNYSENQQLGYSRVQGYSLALTGLISEAPVRLCWLWLALLE